MKIELRKLSDIKPYPGNPRQNDAAVDAVAESIRQFGFRQPIVVDSEGVIICGHTRYKAALKLGLEKVPVHVAKDLTPAQIKAYRIADNQSASLAQWDYELLPIELSALQGMDFDLELLGFSKDELAKIFDPGVKEGLTDPDNVPEPPDEAITQPGDLWILGDHRLLCGDSSNAEHVDRLLGGATIQLVNTDPPYNVKVEPRSNMIYLAVPYSHPDSTVRQQRFDAACRVAAALIRQGRTVFSPVSHGHPICCHGVPSDWEAWKWLDRRFLETCNEVVVVMLDGWQKSVGVRAEIAIARWLEKPITFLRVNAQTEENPGQSRG